MTIADISPLWPLLDTKKYELAAKFCWS